ncbi:ABC transporter substrate-binding protein [Variovorax ginsengisoli]|uniref:ABC-type nitrate/sulfonate/bicarbonate transport system substrate-binding protein n=1 Tax=Variovorax ginsengisoli TaxID=363844 RepID=A0ABT9S2Z6_9BURK|nr:ABC transporter substrate-binding protein [Variovorax ginsengisoli]MDP9898719.1 ABC-type nitrate/sulfonate/bicarbonate transport system substrate-binding protein [Variovorax ginsengisoli]
MRIHTPPQSPTEPQERRRALKTLASLIAVGAGGIGLAACSREERVGTGAAPGAPAVISKAGDKVAFKYPDNPSFDLIYLADQLGYFEGTGTRPQYVGKIAAPQIIPLVGTGEIDFGSRMVPLVISAIASGADLKVVAAGGKTLEEAPHMKYFVRKDSGIRTPKDLEGKTVGFNSFGACAEFVTKKYLREKGVDVTKINFLVVPDEQAEQSLVTGNTDLAIIHAPFSGRADRADQLVRLWSDYDLDGGLGGMAPYSAHGKFIREHPQAVRDVVVALAKAGNWVNANPEEARKLVSKRINMAIENVDRYAYVQDLVVTEPPIQYYIDILQSEGKIAPGKVAIKDVYTNEFNPFAATPAKT